MFSNLLQIAVLFGLTVITSQRNLESPDYKVLKPTQLENLLQEVKQALKEKKQYYVKAELTKRNPRTAKRTPGLHQNDPFNHHNQEKSLTNIQRMNLIFKNNNKRRNDEGLLDFDLSGKTLFNLGDDRIYKIPEDRKKTYKNARESRPPCGCGRRHQNGPWEDLDELLNDIEDEMQADGRRDVYEYDRDYENTEDNSFDDEHRCCGKRGCGCDESGDSLRCGCTRGRDSVHEGQRDSLRCGCKNGCGLKEECDSLRYGCNNRGYGLEKERDLLRCGCKRKGCGLEVEGDSLRCGCKKRGCGLEEEGDALRCGSKKRRGHRLEEERKLLRCGCKKKGCGSDTERDLLRRGSKKGLEDDDFLRCHRRLEGYNLDQYGYERHERAERCRCGGHRDDDQQSNGLREHDSYMPDLSRTRSGRCGCSGNRDSYNRCSCNRHDNDKYADDNRCEGVRNCLSQDNIDENPLDVEQDTYDNDDSSLVPYNNTRDRDDNEEDSYRILRCGCKKRKKNPYNKNSRYKCSKQSCGTLRTRSNKYRQGSNDDENQENHSDQQNTRDKSKRDSLYSFLQRQVQKGKQYKINDHLNAIVVDLPQYLYKALKQNSEKDSIKKPHKLDRKRLKHTNFYNRQDKFTKHKKQRNKIRPFLEQLGLEKYKINDILDNALLKINRLEESYIRNRERFGITQISEKNKLKDLKKMVELSEKIKALKDDYKREINEISLVDLLDLYNNTNRELVKLSIQNNPHLERRSKHKYGRELSYNYITSLDDIQKTFNSLKSIMPKTQTQTRNKEAKEKETQRLFLKKLGKKRKRNNVDFNGDLRKYGVPFELDIQGLSQLN